MNQFLPFEVEGVQYQMLYLVPSKSVKVLTRLMKIISEPLGKALGSMESGESKAESFLNQEINGDLVGKAIVALGERLEEETVWNTIVELLSTVEKANEHNGFSKVTVDVDFRGKIGHLMKVVAKSIQNNYHDFLGQVLGGLKDLQAAQPKTTDQEAKSIGMFGDQSLKK